MIFGIFTLQQFKKLVFDLVLDFGPIFLFAFTYKIFGGMGARSFFLATMVMMLATIISTFLAYQKEKRLPYFPMFVCVLVLCFGFLTLFNRDPDFIKIKDTFQDFIIATAFLLSMLFRYPLLKKIFGHLLPISTRSYNIITWNWIIHFYLLAILNEYVRHSFDTPSWVFYKFIAMSITLIHGLILIYHFRDEVIEGYKRKDFSATDFKHLI